MARPTLPRIRRGRAPGSAGDVAQRVEPRISELSANGLTWVHVDRPRVLEAEGLARRFGFHELDVEDVLSKRQRPKIDEYPDYLFVVLHFPFYDKSVQRLNAAELDVFLGPDFLITLPNAELLPVTYLFRRCEDDADLRADLFAKFKEVVEALEATNESVISHRQNYRLQLLTVFSVVFLPLTLISGIFGMNFGFSSPGFAAVVAVMALLFLSAVSFFRWRRWL